MEPDFVALILGPHGYRTAVVIVVRRISSDLGCMITPPCSVTVDIYRRGTLVSRVLFEILLTLGIAGFDGCQCFQCKLSLLPAHPIAPSGYLAIACIHKWGFYELSTGVYFYSGIAALVISGVPCIIWGVVLFSVSLRHHLHCHRSDVWISGVRDFRWYDQPPSAGVRESNGPDIGFRLWVVGESRGQGAYLDLIRPISRIIFRHTPWRRVVGVEPIWLSLVRGTVGFAFLLGLSAYACLQCISLPLQESSSALPVRDGGISPTPFNLEEIPVALVSDIPFFQILRSLSLILCSLKDVYALETDHATPSDPFKTIQPLAKVSFSSGNDGEYSW